MPKFTQKLRSKIKNITKTFGLGGSPALEEEIRESLLKKKSILASDIALKHDIRISTAKLLLEKFEQEGLIKLFDPSLKLKIYVPISN